MHGELRERDREVAVLAAACDAATRGVGRLMVVEGPAGIGKSSLLLAARSAAGERGLAGARGPWHGARAQHAVRRRAAALRAVPASRVRADAASPALRPGGAGRDRFSPDRRRVSRLSGTVRQVPWSKGCTGWRSTWWGAVMTGPEGRDWSWSSTTPSGLTARPCASFSTRSPSSTRPGSAWSWPCEPTSPTCLPTCSPGSVPILARCDCDPRRSPRAPSPASSAVRASPVPPRSSASPAPERAAGTRSCSASCSPWCVPSTSTRVLRRRGASVSCVPDAVLNAVVVKLGRLPESAARLAGAVAVLAQAPLELAAELADLEVA